VHIALFAQKAGLAPDQMQAMVLNDADDPVWSQDEKLLLRIVDELHGSANLSDELWGSLAATFSIEQVFELIALVGFYHTVSFFANGLRLAPEPYGVPFPPN
jgi:hypothetical protein